MIKQLPDAQLARMLTAQLVDCSCRLGVDVQDVMRHAHRAQVLQFVPGLGPRKAARLLAALQVRVANSKTPSSIPLHVRMFTLSRGLSPILSCVSSILLPTLNG